MKNSIRPLAIIVVSLFGFLLIVSFYADKSQFELSGKEMHDKVMATNYELDSVSFSDLQNPILIDIRDEESYLIDHMPGAINIPLSALLDDDNLDIINKDQPKVILGSTDPIHANEAWMLLTQLGYDSISVYIPPLKEKKLASNVPSDGAMGGH